MVVGYSKRASLTHTFRGSMPPLASATRLLVALCLLAFVVPTTSHAATVYLLSDGKILQLDAEMMLKASKIKARTQEAADRELAKAKVLSDAAAKSEYGNPDDVIRYEKLQAEKYKKRPAPIDPVAVISDGWPDAIDIETDGAWMYVLDKTSIRRFKIHGDGVKHTVAAKLTGILQIVLNGDWLYMRTDSTVSRVKADGSGGVVELSRGWGGLMDIAVHKNVITLRMNDGTFYTLRGKGWKDKLVSKGWKGILRMHNEGGKFYLFSGGQVFSFRPGSRGTPVLTQLSSNLENMWVRKSHLYFSGRGGRVYTAAAKKGARVYEIRPRSTLVDDVAVH